MASNFTRQKKMLEMFKWTLKRNAAITTVYSLFLAMSLPLLQVYLMINNKFNPNFKVNLGDVSENIANILTGSIVLLFSFILAIVSFHYLHNKRQEDLFESLPMAKKELFFARYLAVLVESMVPAIVVTLLGGILAGSADSFCAILKILCFMLMGILVNVSLIGLVSLLSGNTVYTIIGYLLFAFATPALIGTMILLPTVTLPTYRFSEGGFYVISAFAPMIAPYFEPVDNYSSLWHFVYWGIISLIVIVVIYKLVGRRKSEDAESKGFSKTIEYVVVIVTATTAALLGGLFSGIIMDVEKMFVINFVIGAIVAVIGSVIVLELILNRSLKNVKIILISTSVSIVFALGFTATVVYDLTGYVNRVPNSEDVVSITVDGEAKDAYQVKDKKIIKEVVDTHKRQAELFRKNKFDLTKRDASSSDDYYGSKEITYHLQNNSTITRYVELDEKAYNLLDQYGTLNRIRDNKYLDMDAIFLSYSIYDDIVLFDEGESSKNDYKELREAIIKDIDENGIIDKRKEDGFGLEISFDEYGEESTIQFDGRYKRVINWLKKKGESPVNMTEMKNYIKFNSTKGDLKGLATKTTVNIELPKSWQGNGEVYADSVVVESSDDEEMAYTKNSFMDNKCKCKKLSDNKYVANMSIPEKKADDVNIVVYKVKDGIVISSGLLEVYKKDKDTISVKLVREYNEEEYENMDEDDELCWGKYIYKIKN